jgi:hypothetical protein
MPRERTAVASSSRHHDASQMPPPTSYSYEPLEWPLKAQSKIHLQQVKQLPEFKELEELLRVAGTTLAECALEVNEIAALRKEASTKLKNGQEPDEDVDEFMKTAEEASAQIEKSVRATIDEMRDVHNITEALKRMEEIHVQGRQAHLIQVRQAAQVGGTINVDDEEDEDMADITQPGATSQDVPGPGPGPKLVFDEALKAERQKYELISMHNRYAKIPAYIEFKRWEWEGKHAALNDEDRPDVPHSRHWFPERGAPAPGTAPAADDSDDDVQMLKTTLSTKCPLTFSEIKVAISNNQCQHVYEESAMKEYIKNAIRPASRNVAAVHGAQCPVVGCNKTITLSDLYFDKLMQRKIERVREARKREGTSTSRARERAQVIDDDDVFGAVDEDEDDEEEENDDDDDIDMPDASVASRRAKREPQSSRP